MKCTGRTAWSWTELVQRVGRDPNDPISLRPRQQRRRAQVAPSRDEEGSLTQSVGQRGLNHREPLEPTGDLELSQVLGQLRDRLKRDHVTPRADGLEHPVGKRTSTRSDVQRGLVPRQVPAQKRDFGSFDPQTVAPRPVDQPKSGPESPHTRNAFSVTGFELHAGVSISYFQPLAAPEFTARRLSDEPPFR